VLGAVARALGVALLAVVFGAGVLGPATPTDNLVPVFVYGVFWSASPS